METMQYKKGDKVRLKAGRPWETVEAPKWGPRSPFGDDWGHIADGRVLTFVRHDGKDACRVSFSATFGSDYTWVMTSWLERWTDAPATEPAPTPEPAPTEADALAAFFARSEHDLAAARERVAAGVGTEADIARTTPASAPVRDWTAEAPYLYARANEGDQTLTESERLCADAFWCAVGCEAPDVAICQACGEPSVPVADGRKGCCRKERCSASVPF
ncbi:MAG: hypothetical protein H6697_09820 [Myxococcales bacterium]|nr:hypothetical protein [Myxococcales bacterium]